MLNVMPIAADLVRKATVKEAGIESPRASSARPRAARGRGAPRLRQGGADRLRRLADRVEPGGEAAVGDPVPGPGHS